MSLSYHPLGLAYVSVCVVAVHRLLAHPILPILLQHGSKLIGCPPATEPVLGLWILNQPIDRPLKVLVSGQLDPFHLCKLHLLLQHLHVECGNIYAAGVLKGILDHLPCSIVEHGADFSLAKSVNQTKIFLHVKEN
jgi:hypothetical protein